jgi:2-haloacid dehalogenase
MNRRDFFALSMGAVVEILPRSSSAQPAVMPKALIFDTFGTVVDWRGSIIEEGTAWGKSKHFEIDWAGFADRWRAGYAPSMEKANCRGRSWMTCIA